MPQSFFVTIGFDLLGGFGIDAENSLGIAFPTWHWEDWEIGVIGDVDGFFQLQAEADVTVGLAVSNATHLDQLGGFGSQQFAIDVDPPGTELFGGGIEFENLLGMGLGNIEGQVPTVIQLYGSWGPSAMETSWTKPEVAQLAVLPAVGTPLSATYVQAISLGELVDWLRE